ncbi:hypothetical protein Efla_006448 [Eimeria flavescens]
MPSSKELEAVGDYQPLRDETHAGKPAKICVPLESEPEVFFSDTGRNTHNRKPIRSTKKRADIQAATRERAEKRPEPAGRVWAACVGAEVLFTDFLKATKRPEIISPRFLKVEKTYSEVLYCKCFSKLKTIFIFKFGCVVAWDIEVDEQKSLIAFLQPYLKEPLGAREEEDTMTYIWAERATIKGDNIHLVTTDIFECLAYSYAFAQSVKLAVFETLVDADIERTKMIPESLARTGNIQSTREDIGRRIGELFVNRFYINLHTDILDTPDIFWENDDFADHYDHCRRYLEIPKRVEILNQRLDIIKDLYDMLNNELTIQHGYKLEWIVIYLICIEVLIDVVWNIIIKDVLKWV